jgi:Family of unknown function (DUF6493)
VADWPGLKELIDRHDVAGVAALVRGMGAEDRRALAGPLKEYERQLRRDFEWGPQSALSVAGAAVLPGLSALVPWLARNAAWWDRSDQRGERTASAVLDVLRDRGVPWLPELAVLLAERLPRGRDFGGLWPMVSALVSATGIEPPLTDGYVIHWADDHRWGAGAVGKIRLDPRLATLVPRLFEIDQVAGQFEPIDGLGRGWPAAFAALVTEGLADRAVLIDSCLAGLQCSGRLGALRGLLAVHDALDLDLAEIAAHARDYLALLPAAHSTVARAAQRQLRRLDEAGLLDEAMVREASEAVLLRPEKILVRAQLDWLGKAAARDPSRAGELALAAATAFSHEAADLQAQALRVVLRQLAGLDADATAELAAAAAALPADLRARAAKAFGPVWPADETVMPMPVAPAPAAMPPPLGSAEEVAAELGALYARVTDELDPVSLERVLAGLVAFSYDDRPALAAALQPLLARYEWIEPGSPYREHDHQLPVLSELDLIIGAAVVPAKGSASGGLSYPPDWGPAWLSGPHAALITRMREIAAGVWETPRPMLVSVPSTSTGLIDPGELLGRLRRAAGDGWEPWPVDLMQALLRLPRDRDPTTAAQAAALGTPAGMALARRLSAGAPDPAVVAEIRMRHHWSTIGAPRIIRLTGPEPAAVSDMLDVPRLVVTNVGEQLILATVGSAGPGSADDPCQLVGELTEPERWFEFGNPAVMVGYETSWLSCWPMLLPAHRDVIAAHLVPYLRMAVRDGRGAGAALPGLAAADGPVGAGMQLALGYGLAAHDWGDRAAAADALITLAARDQLDGQAFGEKLGVLIALGTLPLARVVPGLRELARAGAQAAVWSLVAAALPLILPPAVDQPPQRAGDLIALGVEVAQVVRPAAALPCVGKLAARRGSSQLIVQARRLRDALAAARP